MKELLISICILGASSQSWGYLGNWPDYDILHSADIVVLIDSESVRVEQSDRMPMGIGIILPIPEAIPIKGDVSGDIRYGSDAASTTSEARSLIVYLKKDEAGTYSLVNRMCSTIPTSLSVEEVLKAKGNSLDMLSALARVFPQEINTDCAALQARIIVTGPEGIARETWKELVAKPPQAEAEENPKLRLARLVVGLHAVGAEILSTEDFRDTDFGPIAKPEAGVTKDAWPSSMRSTISTWVWRNATPANIEPIIRFTLRQSGQFQAELFSAMSGHVPREKFGEIVQFLANGTNTAAKYGCVRAVYQTFRRGSGTPGVDAYLRNPRPHIAAALKIARENGIVPRQSSKEAEQGGGEEQPTRLDSTPHDN